MAATEIDEFGAPVADLDDELSKLYGIKVIDKTEGTQEPAKPKYDEKNEVSAHAALIAEAKEAGHVIFEFEGDEYTVPPAEDWDLDVVEHAEEGRFVSAVKLLVGETQWATFKKTKRKNTDLQRFFEASQRALGAKPGE